MTNEINKSTFAKGDNPYVIAGPCSAETRKQVLAIAHELKKMIKCIVFV